MPHIGVAVAAALAISGPSSWYGGPCDPGDNNIPAYAPKDANQTPGVAMRTYSTRLKLFLLRGSNGRLVVVQHTDYGPAAETGRTIDVNYRAANGLGYSGDCARGFPTDSIFDLRELDRRGASWWAWRTRTTVDDRWIVRKWVLFKLAQDKRERLQSKLARR